MEERKIWNGYYNYTVVLTYLGMLIGFLGIISVFEGEYRHAVLCLMMSGICDMFDGGIAATKERDRREKRFGVQIDSLSDLICFGVLPALITYGVSGKSYFSFTAGSLYLLCALIRLAYFNVMEEERQDVEEGGRSYYQGLPVTTSALLFPAWYTVGIKMQYNHMGIMLELLLICMAIAFISTFQVKKPYMAGKIGIVIAGSVQFFILLLGMGFDV